MFVKLNNKGDTIIEVMLSLAVLGALITSAYTIASRSLNGIRISQERSEATKIAEGQLEVIRNAYVNTKSQEEVQKLLFNNSESGDFENMYFGANNELANVLGMDPWGFCVTDENSANAKSLFFNQDDAKKMSSYTANPDYIPCVKDGRYMVYINNNYFLTPTNQGNVLQLDNVYVDYKVSVFWERSNGGGIEQLTMQDKLIMGK